MIDGDASNAVDHRLHRGIAQLGEEGRLPVVQRSAREAGVEHRVDRGVRHRLDEVDRGRPEGAQRCQVGLGLRQGPGVAQREATQLHPAAVRGVDERAEDRRLVGQLLGELPEHVVHLGRGGQRVGDEPAEDDVERVGLELEGCRDPEVAPSAPERPEQVGLDVGVDDPHLAVGGDDLDLGDVVDRQPVHAHEPAEAPTQGQPGDAGGRDDPAGCRLPVDAGGAVVLVPGGATLHPGPPAGGIDVDAAHQGQVDHQPALGHGPARHVVAPAPHRDLQAGVAPEVDGIPDVGHVVATGDQPWSLVDQTVVHGPRHVVAGIAGSQQ